MWEAVCLMALSLHSARPSERFGWNARLDHYLRRTYHPRRMSLLAGETAFEHAIGDPSEHGPGAGGFGRRYSIAFSSRIVQNTVEFAAAGLLDEDYRYRASGQRGLGRRLKHALLHPLFTSGGRHRFAASRAIATASGSIFSGATRGRPLTAGYLAPDIGFAYLGHMQNSLLAEFEDDLKAYGKRLVQRLPRFELRKRLPRVYHRRLGD